MAEWSKHLPVKQGYVGSNPSLYAVLVGDVGILRKIVALVPRPWVRLPSSTQNLLNVRQHYQGNL